MNDQLRCLIVLLLPIFMLVGCQRSTAVGVYQSPENISLIKNGNMTADEIVKLIGVPTIVNDNNWYYVATTIVSRSFMSKKITQQQTLCLTFNQQKLCSATKLVDDNFNNALSPYTGTTVQEFLNQRNIWQEYLYCMSKYTDSKKKKQKFRST